MEHRDDDTGTAPQTGELILVEWSDSASLGEEVWHDTSDVETLELSVAYTVGQLVREDKDVLVVSGSWTDDAQHSGVMCIPIVSIRRRYRLSKI